MTGPAKQKARRGVPPAVAFGVIAGVHVVAFAYLYWLHYRHVVLFCGDSAFYMYLADTMKAAADRPSGWPFVMKALAAIARDPRLFVAFNGALLFGSHAMLYDGARRAVGSTPALLLTLAFALSPMHQALSSMGFMADAFVLFLCMAGLRLMQLGLDLDGWRRTAALAAAGLAIGYASIVKAVFVYAGAVALGVLAASAASEARRHAARAAAVFGAAAVFVAVPLAYARWFAKPRIGRAIVEGFGARSTLANVIPHLRDCAALERLVPQGAGRDVVRIECAPELLKDTPQVILWSKDGLLNRIGRRLPRQEGRDYYLETDRTMRPWAWRTLIFAPGAVATAALTSGRAAFVETGEKAVLGDINGLSGGCEGLVADRFFGSSPGPFLRGWTEHYRARSAHVAALTSASRLPWLAGLACVASSAIAALLLLLTMRNPAPLRAAALAASAFAGAHLLASAVGSAYDWRYYALGAELCAFSLALSLGALAQARAARAG